MSRREAEREQHLLAAALVAAERDATRLECGLACLEADIGSARQGASMLLPRVR